MVQQQCHPPFVVTWISDAIRCKMSVVRFNSIYILWLTSEEINVHYVVQVSLARQDKTHQPDQTEQELRQI